jgi:hypothetical protein
MRKAAMEYKIGAINSNCGVSMEKKSQNHVHGFQANLRVRRPGLSLSPSGQVRDNLSAGTQSRRRSSQAPPQVSPGSGARVYSAQVFFLLSPSVQVRGQTGPGPGSRMGTGLLRGTGRACSCVWRVTRHCPMFVSVTFQVLVVPDQAPRRPPGPGSDPVTVFSVHAGAQSAALRSLIHRTSRNLPVS